MRYCTDENGYTFQLQRCPFCGMDVAELLTQTELMEEANVEPYDHAERYTIVCAFNKRGCGATCGFHDSKADAIKRWNTRVII